MPDNLIRNKILTLMRVTATFLDHGPLHLWDWGNWLVHESNHIINHLSIFESILGKQQTAQSLADKYSRPDLIQHLHKFLYNQLHNDSSSSSSSLTESTDVPLASLPNFQGKIQVHPSTVTTFYASSDLSGVGGMCHQHRTRLLSRL